MMGSSPPMMAPASPNLGRGPTMMAQPPQQQAIPVQMGRPQPPPPQPSYVPPPQQSSYELPPARRFIPPPSKASSQQKQARAERLKALMRPGVVQLRDVDITLYDSAPLTPYELQTRFGSSQNKAKGTQTGAGNPTIAIQTEEIEVMATGMQWPEDGPAAGMSGAAMQSSESARTASLMTANVGR